MSPVHLVGRSASDNRPREFISADGVRGKASFPLVVSGEPVLGGVAALVAGRRVLGPEGHQRSDLVAIHPGPAVAGAPVRLKAVLAHQAVQGVPADAELPGDVAQGRCIHRNRSLPRRTVAYRCLAWQTVAK